MKAILACDRLGGIGFNGAMPWPKQETDLLRFKELTTGKTIVMGRGTWESKGIPKPLPNRTNIVISQSDLPLPENVIQCKTIKDLEQYNVDWCIGGARLFESLFDQIDEIHLSKIRNTFVCDTGIDLTRITEEFELVRDQLCLTHNYQIWKRK
jgi:dihydrofolate reductase